MILNRRFRAPLLLLMAMVGLGACDPVSLTLGAGATAGLAAYQERGIEGVARDTAIEARIFKLWAQSDKKMVVHMSIEVYESRALLTGIASSEEERANAVGMAWKADGVEDVMNEILIGEPPGFGEIARDTAITAELKSKLTFDDKVLAVNYAIETVRGTIFLLGIAQDQAELDHVITRARNISYVKRVVSYVRVKVAGAAGEGEGR
jgi:osmotically-inducible protein OsmY